MLGGSSGPDRLNVTQAYTLVATSDVSGRHLGPQRFVNYAVAGAVFADLGIAGRIKVDLDRGDRVRVLSASRPGTRCSTRCCASSWSRPASAASAPGSCSWAPGSCAPRSWTHWSRPTCWSDGPATCSV